MAHAATRVRTRRSDVGAWEMAEAPPAPQLAGLVRSYTGFVERAAQPLRRLEASSPTPVLILNFGAPLEVSAPGRTARVHTDSFFARVSHLPATTEFTGVSAGIQVDFTPLGAYLFCGHPMDELPDPALGMTELLGPDGRRLTEMVEAAPGWNARFDLLDAEIMRRVGGARPPTPSVAWAWSRLEACSGRVEIGRLSDALGCSPKHLILGFRQEIGVTPKVAARILRFQRATRRAREPGPVNLARVAADCGYHDQAHMAREFRALAGTTPSAYVTASLPGYLGIAG